jgi:hypothetical protein
MMIPKNFFKPNLKNLLTLDGDEETTVETNRTIRLEDLDKTITQTLEFTGGALADISGETGTGEVEWVDEAQRSGTGGTTRSQVHHKEFYELLVLVNSKIFENLFSKKYFLNIRKFQKKIFYKPISVTMTFSDLFLTLIFFIIGLKKFEFGGRDFVTQKFSYPSMKMRL